MVKSYNEKAMAENRMWKRYEGKYYKAWLLCDGDSGGWHPVGYLMWTGKRKLVILNQLWISEKYRRQGAGSFLLQEWYNQITAKRHREMYIESPSREMILLMLKIGYAHMDGDKCVSDKFSIALH
jgi:GNAT superfamily N-acetyltransferase